MEKYHIRAVEVILEMHEYIINPKVLANAREIGSRMTNGSKIPEYMLTRLEEHMQLIANAWANDSEITQLLQEQCMPIGQAKQVLNTMQRNRDLLRYNQE